MTTQEQILEIIRQVIGDIYSDVGSVGDLFSNGVKADLIEAIFARLDELGFTLSDLFPRAVAESYATGIQSGNALMIEAGIGAASLGTATAAATIKRRIHLEAIDFLISGGMQDLRTAINTAKINAVDTIDNALDAVKKEIGRSIMDGANRKKASARVSEAFARNGLTGFVTSDGKRLPLDFYASMVTRTKTREAHTGGAENRYQEAGVDLVYIEKHSPTCDVCAKRQGIVISLSGKTPGYPTKKETGLPPFHPHCQCTIRPYVIEHKSKEQIVKDKKPFSPDDDPRSDAQKKAYEKEQEIRRRANQEKKEYEQIKAVLGDKAPKTIGAYRRMRRKNDKKWQQLQNEYKNAIETQDRESGS
ncbi:phage minor capsid protein [Bacillus cereus]|uniref:phage minor capsid protein n=1 Tax=Bacillus cereus TaxID=1396 RepID=UPI003D65CBB0